MYGREAVADRLGERWCSGCDQWLPFDHFWSDPYTGKERRRCRSCMRRYGSEWWRKNRKGHPRGWKKCH